MDNPLLKIITLKAKESFQRFVMIIFSGVFFSLALIILLDYFHSNFCENVPNLYFWKCIYSFAVHFLFLLIFPLAYFTFAIVYAQKYLVYLLIELIIQKAKYHSVEWLMQYIPLSIEPIIQKISQKLKISESKTEKIIEYLLNLPFQRIMDLFLPNLNLFWLLLAFEFMIFLLVWVRL